MAALWEVTLDGLVRLLVSHDHQHLAGMQWLLMRLNADLGPSHSPSSEVSPNSVISNQGPRGAFFIVAGWDQLPTGSPDPSPHLAGRRWAAPVVDRTGIPAILS